MNSLLATERSALAVTVMKPAIPHLYAGFCLVAARSFEPGKTVGLYFEKHVYINLVDEKQKWKIYKE